MNARAIYLDNNATTRCAPEVLAAMLPFLQEDYGNAASPHSLGRSAALAVANAREKVAECIQCDCSEIYFTSGATEANNLVLLGIPRDQTARRNVVTSAVEHKSVLEPLAGLARDGLTVVKLPVTERGVLDLNVAHANINDETLLVTIQAANNEVGTLQPISAIAEIAHQHGALVHCDAAQLLGKLPFAVNDLGVDFATFSAHKAYGPKGVGFLFARNADSVPRLRPSYVGGGQERGLRPGTLNVPGIVGTGQACQLCQQRARADADRIGALRLEMEERIRAVVPNCLFAGACSDRLPGTSCMVFPDVQADALLCRLPEVCVSIGSACSSGTLAPSHVLLAMGFSSDAAQSAIRVSIGRYNTHEEIERAAWLIGTAVKELLSEPTS